MGQGGEKGGRARRRQTAVWKVIGKQRDPPELGNSPEPGGEEGQRERRTVHRKGKPSFILKKWQRLQAGSLRSESELWIAFESANKHYWAFF